MIKTNLSELRYTNEYCIKHHSLETNHSGVEELMRFYKFASNLYNTSVILDVSQTKHIDANLSAVILSISHKLLIDRRVKLFVELGDGKDVFFRNGLISHLTGRGNLNEYFDNRQSTIALKTFHSTEDENFCTYLRKDFLGHRSMESMDPQLKNYLRNCYLEVFTNVYIHAETDYPIFTCGQYFPDKGLLKFTLVDLGVGFLKKIKNKTDGLVDDDKSAIVWATKGVNSTKDISFGPGGTGLKQIKKFCSSNNGSLHICSGNGYINLLQDKTLEHSLSTAFPGSLINIIIRDV